MAPEYELSFCIQFSSEIRMIQSQHLNQFVLIHILSAMDKINLPFGEEEERQKNEPQEKKYKMIEWTQQIVFEAADEQANAHWKKHDVRSDRTGRKTRFYCNSVSCIKGRACPAQIIVHALDGCQRTILYSNGDPHEHDGDEQVKANTPMSQAVKTKIKEMSAHFFPRQIYIEFQKDDDIQPKPTVVQVFHFLLFVLCFFIC